MDTQTPKISSWQDIDAVLSKTGARYSYQVAKVDQGHCDPVAGTNTGESLPLASIFKLYVLHALAVAVKNGTVSWDDQLTVTDKSRAVGSSGLELPAGGACFGSQGGREDDRHQRQHGDRLAHRQDGHARHGGGAGHGRSSRSRQHDAVPHDVRAVLRRLGSTGSARPVEAGVPAGARPAAGGGEFDSLPSRSDSGPLSGVVLWRGVVRHRRGHLPCPRGAASRCGRPGGPGQADPFCGVGYSAGSQRLALHRSESGWPAGRPDVQLVRRRQDAAAMGCQLPVELAPRSRADRDRDGCCRSPGRPSR